MRPTRDYRGLESRSREQERQRKAFWLAAASLWTLSFRQQMVDPKDILRTVDEDYNIALKSR